ncbi:hypothetical protein BLNAU_13715 [Blattamonas nauphoetae]|uniref:Uncharacterized protein n=1 Tax=Blattamonas nauphoetae TaxID=2049346 RepID=A0ABQ9XFU6_9EUKA|nr:hypothetical protein BLNAU_13715 [Blattamonas nauphoetae]
MTLEDNPHTFHVLDQFVSMLPRLNILQETQTLLVQLFLIRPIRQHAKRAVHEEREDILRIRQTGNG